MKDGKRIHPCKEDFEEATTLGLTYEFPTGSDAFNPEAWERIYKTSELQIGSAYMVAVADSNDDGECFIKTEMNICHEPDYAHDFFRLVDADGTYWVVDKDSDLDNCIIVWKYVGDTSVADEITLSEDEIENLI